MLILGQKAQGKTLRYADRICRVERRSSGAPKWFIRCQAQDCAGEVSLSYAMAQNEDFCIGCRKVLVFGEHHLDRRLTPIVSKIVAVSRRRRGKYMTMFFWFRCENTSCGNVLKTYEYLQHGQTHCSSCRTGVRRMLFGVEVKDESIWLDRGSIVGCERDARGTRHWLKKCITGACPNTIRLRKGDKYKGTCLPCRSLARRKKPFECNYRAAVGLAKSKGWDFFLTLEEYAEFCRVDFCFYCDERLGRIAWRKHANAKGAGKFMDRADSLLPYSVGNILPSCARCNTLKGKNKSVIQTLIEINNRIGNFNRLKDVRGKSNWRQIYKDWRAAKLAQEAA